MKSLKDVITEHNKIQELKRKQQKEQEKNRCFPKCKDFRILKIALECEDACTLRYGNQCYDGEPPEIPNIFKRYNGNIMNMNVCLECGKVQGKFPIGDINIHGDIGEEDYDEDEDYEEDDYEEDDYDDEPDFTTPRIIGRFH